MTYLSYEGLQEKRKSPQQQDFKATWASSGSWVELLQHLWGRRLSQKQWEEQGSVMMLVSSLAI
jgi:hypothetical protein